ncbi:hypothetical protein D3227_33870 [Mesorhizobium waimense]|uniref:Uncharacterized protein n=1 Tax=Mesorhizobium waimense TaxID=1300307 RepID=A0A3A5K0P5_9HYPH|nr:MULTISPECIES: hypothetical protein [Mesorhizobium]OWK22009.1 hypothetical protein AJ88_13920 [Mesorhizobium amorphae CCBAU 01583]RJT28632.1 hypothetical protein D3227_33870 [Mesorhizobium waimense]
MSNREIGHSHTLGRRVAALRARMEEARVTEHEMKTFLKVVAAMEERQGRIEGDDLIAISFVAAAA